MKEHVVVQITLCLLILTDKPKYKGILELLIDLTGKLNTIYFRD